jgi:hypothetical protein
MTGCPRSTLANLDLYLLGVKTREAGGQDGRMHPFQDGGQLKAPSFRVDVQAGSLRKTEEEHGMQRIIGKGQRETDHRHRDGVDGPPNRHGGHTLNPSHVHK